MTVNPYLGNADSLFRIQKIAESQLAGMVRSIDEGGEYPESVLKALGQDNAFQMSSCPNGAPPALLWNIECTAVVSTYCLSTAFCMWCQNALRWYLASSENRRLDESIGSQIAAGSLLGGTALSNPMKHLAGIEPLKFRANRVQGGYVVSGAIPWVSNLGQGHYFAAVFGLEENANHKVMALISCNQEGVVLGDLNRFIALNGTRTYSIRLDRVFVPDEDVIAEPATAYIEKIRCGFILLQTGIAIGLIRSTIDIMLQARISHAHINQHLTVQPEEVAGQLSSWELQIQKLSATPFDSSPAYLSEVLTARLGLADLAVSSATAALLHEGARGYLSTSQSQRRLRESLFLAILTPATKQLRKMLSALKNH